MQLCQSNLASTCDGRRPTATILSSYQRATLPKPCPKALCYFPKIREPQYRPQNTTVLVIWTPKMSTPDFGKPLSMPIRRVATRKPSARSCQWKPQSDASVKYILGYIRYMGILENKMEATIVYWGLYIGMMEKWKLRFFPLLSRT